jgi:hypothetical protein
LSRYVPDGMIPDKIFFPTLGIMYVKYDMSTDISYKRLSIKMWLARRKARDFITLRNMSFNLVST